MLNDNQYYYEDEFMYFNFNNVHSSEYNLFMVNTGDNIKIVNNTNSSTEYSSPAYQGTTYYLGTTKKQKEFKYNCAAKGLTFAKCRELFQWLSVGTLGYLILYDNPNWGYDVVLEEVGDAIKTKTGQDQYIVEFEITFKTVGTYLASSVYPSSLNDIKTLSNKIIDETTDYKEYDHTIANEYGIPEIDCIAIDTTTSTSNMTYTINLPSVCNEYSYLDFNFNVQSLQQLTSFLLEIDKAIKIGTNTNDTEYLKYVKYNITNSENLNAFTFKSKLGFLLQNNTIPAEQLIGKVSSEQSQGLLSFDNIIPLKLNSKFNDDDNTLSLEDNEINFINGLPNNFICFVTQIEDNNLPYSGVGYNDGNDGKEWSNLRYSYQATIIYDFTVNNSQITLNNIPKSTEYDYIYIGTYNQIKITISKDFIPSLTLYKNNNI